MRQAAGPPLQGEGPARSRQGASAKGRELPVTPATVGYRPVWRARWGQEGVEPVGNALWEPQAP